MANKNGVRRKGTVPQHVSKPTPPPVVSNGEHGFPVLCLRHLQGGWELTSLTPKQCQEFLAKWHKRAQLSWLELHQHPKHGLGSELLDRSMFKPRVPEWLERDRYMVFRHEGNLPFAGFRTGDIFHVLWIEARYNDLCNH